MTNKTIIAFDIETIADRSAIPFLPEPKPNGRLKDPAKIESDIAEKKAKQLAEMGLSPMTNMVCCLSWCDSDNRSGNIVLESEDPAHERECLLNVWEDLSAGDIFVTFNGRSFDLPTIRLHSLKHNIKMPVDIDSGRYNRGNHIDMRQILAGEDKFAPGKLDFFAQRFLGVGKTEGIAGKDIQNWWDVGLKEDIANYCDNDAKITMGLFELARNCGLIII